MVKPSICAQPVQNVEGEEDEEGMWESDFSCSLRDVQRALRGCAVVEPPVATDLAQERVQQLETAQTLVD